MSKQRLVPVFKVRFSSNQPLTHGFAHLDAWIDGWNPDKEYTSCLYDYETKGIHRVRIHTQWDKDRLDWHQDYPRRWTMKGDASDDGLNLQEMEVCIKVARRLDKSLHKMVETMGDSADVLDLLFRLARALRITRYIIPADNPSWTSGRPQEKLVTATDVRYQVVSRWETWAAQFQSGIPCHSCEKRFSPSLLTACGLCRENICSSCVKGSEYKTPHLTDCEASFRESEEMKG
jgi:hypothetical protein